jgi:hypothetical protein
VLWIDGAKSGIAIAFSAVTPYPAASKGRPIPCAMRWTVPVPTPTSRATFRMPSPERKCSLMRFSSLPLMRGRPSGSMSFTNEEGEEETDDLTYNRQDFWATTSNKQLNFVQHMRGRPRVR